MEPAGLGSLRDGRMTGGKSSTSALMTMGLDCSMSVSSFLRTEGQVPREEEGGV